MKVVPPGTRRIAKAFVAIIGLAHLPANQAHAIVSVTSPAYRADVSGNTTIQISAPGQTAAVAKCWQNGPGLGQDTTVATVALNGSGNGSFVFPANSYPHGPITIRITAGSDTCHLQLYNTGGTSWKEGLAAAPTPSQAAGMTLAYADDFNGPLSISTTGSGATYGSHTVGYKDFSRPKFRNFADGNNPFFQRDTYLRIRATTVADETGTPAEIEAAKAANWDNWNAGTGLICSVGQDKTGFKMQAPFYMECRFVAHRAAGTWPAFWSLSIPNGSEKYGEIDVIESYGSVSQRRYTAGYHRWPTDPHEHLYKLVQMDGSIPGTANADWSDTVHTYGCKVTPMTTTYYLDNVAVWSHPTRPEWLTQDFYFLINYAIAGQSGWLSALGRYGFKSDMYVDWVRVYNGGPSEIVVDNSDSSGVTIAGSWTPSTSASGYYGADYLHDGNTGKGSKSVRFTPTIAAGGSYEVFALWTPSSNRASDVPVDVVSAGGTTGLSVDQRTGDGQWVSLGTYNFNAGTGGSVLIGTADTDGYVIADAVAFRAGGGGSAIPSPARIVNSYTSKALRPYDAGVGDNVNIVQYIYNNTWTSQRWQITDLGNGYHSIINVYTGKSLRPLDASQASGANIVQFTYTSGWESEQWELIPNGAGYYGIRNRYSGLALRPLNGGTGSNVTIVQESYDPNISSMKWQIAAP